FQKGPVLMVWVLDASGSLRERRDQVIQRFDRVNKELNDLGKMREDVLLNSVVSFGSSIDFVTEQPTSDFKELQSAVRKINLDDSGEEKVFSAIRAAAQRYRKYQTHGRRNIMMVVLT